METHSGHRHGPGSTGAPRSQRSIALAASGASSRSWATASTRRCSTALFAVAREFFAQPAETEAAHPARRRESLGLLRPGTDQDGGATGRRSSISVLPTAAAPAAALAGGRLARAVRAHAARATTVGARRCRCSCWRRSRRISACRSTRSPRRSAAAHTSFLRLNHYPAHPDAGGGKRRHALGVGEHTRLGRADGADAGRSAGTRGSSRRPLAPGRAAWPARLVINLGDIVQVWSNDRYRRRAAPCDHECRRTTATACRSSSTRRTTRATSRCRRH